MEATTDGFELAEIDLQYRGPGEFLGVRQSGETDIPLEILTDKSLISTVQEAALTLLEQDEQTVKAILEVDELESLLV